MIRNLLYWPFSKIVRGAMGTFLFVYAFYIDNIVLGVFGGILLILTAFGGGCEKSCYLDTKPRKK